MIILAVILYFVLGIITFSIWAIIECKIYNTNFTEYAQSEGAAILIIIVAWPLFALAGLMLGLVNVYIKLMEHIISGKKKEENYDKHRK